MNEVTGLAEVQRNMAKMLTRIKGDVQEAIEDVALDLQAKSVQLAPIDRGDLRRSGYTEFVKSPSGFVAEIGFGTDYAIEQHENLEFRHPRGGQAKYLEQPFKENLPRYVNHIKDKAKI